MDGTRIAWCAAAAALACGLPSAGAQTAGAAWCKAPESTAWHNVLFGSVVKLSRRASLVPLDVSGDGRTFFAAIYSSRFSGVVKVNARTSRYAPVRRFDNPELDQAVGTFGGRWLVWQELHSPSDTGDFTVWAWDSSTGHARQIGSAGRDPSGGFWVSPWRVPDVRDGYATWAQGSGPDGVTDVHVYDLRRHSDRVVRHGHAQGSFLVAGRRVAWPESLRPGTSTVKLAANARTGASVPAPASIRRLRGISGLATDGSAVAFPDAGYKSLWWSPVLRMAPRRVFATRRIGDHVDNTVQISGRYVFFGAQPHAYIADAATRRYMPVGAGWGRLDGTGFVLLRPSRGKGSHAISDLVFLRRAAFPPIPAC